MVRMWTSRKASDGSSPYYMYYVSKASPHKPEVLLLAAACNETDASEIFIQLKEGETALHHSLKDGAQAVPLHRMIWEGRLPLHHPNTIVFNFKNTTALDMLRAELIFE